MFNEIRNIYTISVFRWNFTVKAPKLTPKMPWNHYFAFPRTPFLIYIYINARKQERSFRRRYQEPLHNAGVERCWLGGRRYAHGKVFHWWARYFPGRQACPQAGQKSRLSALFFAKLSDSDSRGERQQSPRGWWLAAGDGLRPDSWHSVCLQQQWRWLYRAWLFDGDGSGDSAWQVPDSWATPCACASKQEAHPGTGNGHQPALLLGCRHT